MKAWKKRLFAAVLCGLFCVGALSGCGTADAASSQKSGSASSGSGSGSSSADASQSNSGSTSAQTGEVGLPQEFPMEFEFSSGAGGWMTVMTVERDGSFTGVYHDSDMGDVGKDYPNGTEYLNRFSGRFGGFEQRDEHSMTMVLEELKQEEPDKEWIEDGIRYITQEAYGLDGGKNFVLYLPDTPVEGLDEEFLSWWPGRFEQPVPDTLNQWGIENVEMEEVFFSVEDCGLS